MSDTELMDRAADFWADTDLADVFPRNVEQAIALKLPVTIVKLPVVTVQAVGRWLRRHRRVPTIPSYRRELMGCLYADGGHGFIFLSGADEPDEQRFTLAHDAAHFLVDYAWPRQRVIDALGDSIIPVLDGRRRVSPAERASALLARVRLGPHCHLLPRHDGDETIVRIEDRADELGRELVAPRDRVLRELKTMPQAIRADVPAACRALGMFFGLPGYVFRPLISSLHRQRVPSFVEDTRRLVRRDT